MKAKSLVLLIILFALIGGIALFQNKEALLERRLLRKTEIAVAKLDSRITNLERLLAEETTDAQALEENLDLLSVEIVAFRDMFQIFRERPRETPVDSLIGVLLQDYSRANAIFTIIAQRSIDPIYRATYGSVIKKAETAIEHFKPELVPAPHTLP